MTKEQYVKVLNSLIKNVQDGDSQATRMIIDLESYKYKLVVKEESK